MAAKRTHRYGARIALIEASAAFSGRTGVGCAVGLLFARLLARDLPMPWPANARSGTLLRPAAGALLLATALTGPPLAAQATSTSVQKFQHSPAAAFDAFGRAVSVQGDHALVTALGVDATGAAFGFRRSGGIWTQSQKFHGNDTAYGDAFGLEAQIAGEFAVVSSHQTDLGGMFNAGAAYVFRDDGTNWVQLQKLVAPDPAAFDFFSYSVAMAGDLVVVGAIDDDDGGNLTGSAYVFRRSGATWVFEQKLHASNPDPEDEFGFDIETDGQTIVVASPVDSNGGIATGSVYVFRHNGASWVETQRISPVDGDDGCWFGWDLDLDGERLAVGAPERDLTKNDGGAVYTYLDNGTSFVPEDEFAPSKLSASDVFGWSVSLQGDRLVAGAPSTTIAGGLPFDGAVYLFHFDGTRWVEVHQWVSSDEAVDEWPVPNLGQSCSLDGTTVFVGAPFHDGGVNNSGAAYRFELADLGLDAVPDAAPAGGSMTLHTDGGLAGAKTALLLTNLGGTPLTYVVWVTTFDLQGKTALSFVVPPAVAGLQATFLSAGFWNDGPFALSNAVTVTFQ